MHFTALRLQHFRNYPLLTLKPSPGITVLYGDNGSGKTNVLEAMHLLALGRSHRTSTDKEMIAQGQQNALIYGETLRRDGKHDIQVRLFTAQRPQKRVLLYGKPAPRIGDMMGHATCVMFSPEDLRIVRDGPAARRRFVDMQLSQIRPSYLRALKTYLSVLDRRNALLKAHRQGALGDFEAQLDTWDEQLAAAAVPVVLSRRWFLAELALAAAKQYAAIAEDKQEVFTLRYAGPLAQAEDPLQAMLSGLHRARSEDVYRLFTTFGPHRDDVSLLLCNRELRAFGSQGQVRSAILSMKLGELSLIEREMGEPPALLLDDVFSELDVRRRGALLQSAQGLQTFLTCTDKQDAAGVQADVFIRVCQDETGHALIAEG